MWDVSKNRENCENELNDSFTLLKEKQLEKKSLNEDLTIMRKKKIMTELRIKYIRFRVRTLKRRIMYYRCNPLRKIWLLQGKNLNLLKQNVFISHMLPQRRMGSFMISCYQSLAKTQMGVVSKLIRVTQLLKICPTILCKTYI